MVSCSNKSRTSWVDEINPAVAVTGVSPLSGCVEIHVVYQIWRSSPSPGHYEVWHTYTTDFGVTWTASGRISQTGKDARNPACVYTEDQSFFGPNYGYAIQVVWQEYDSSTFNLQWNIWYRILSYDPITNKLTWSPPPTGTGSAYLIATNPFGKGHNCINPEIASVDETSIPTEYGFYFAIVWEQDGLFDPITQTSTTHVWYMDGYFKAVVQRNPPPHFISFTIWRNTAGRGQIDPMYPMGYHTYATEPDIAATQDWQIAETYFYHITYEYMDIPIGKCTIESDYYWGITQTPGAVGFIPTTTVTWLPITFPSQLLNPTIAVRLIGINPTIYQTYICWENHTGTTPPDIFYRMGLFNTAVPPFAWLGAALPVGYTPLTGEEYNPEIWTRGDFLSIFPSCIHLAFDDNTSPGGNADITYIDP